MTAKKAPPLLHDEDTGDGDVRDDAVIGVAFRWSLIVICFIVVCATAAAWWWTGDAPPPPVRKTEVRTTAIRELPPVEPPRIMFSNITREAGIDFVHENGAAGDKLLPETMGGGAAFFDFDGDQDQDLIFVNSQHWPGDDATDGADAEIMRLYRNDGRGYYEDVTEGSGLDISLYGMGVAVGDYDNDGRVDVFISALGGNRLFQNVGDGKFTDVTEPAQVAGDNGAWSTSCGWFDYDNDGDLDLFVANYVEWSKEYDLAQNFQLTGGGRAYGRPQNFEGTFPYLYRNDGGGRFTEVGETAGLHVRNPATGAAMAKGLGVALADFDGDGWIDIVLANDTVQNFFYHNLGNGQFQEIGAMTGIAFDTHGNARGAMGIDVGRFRNNESMGVVIGNFANEMTALYVAHDGELYFSDEAVPTGLGPTTRQQLTFGVFYFDADLDGRLDLLAANGHLEEDIQRVQPSQRYEQPPQLFWNCGPQYSTEFIPLGVAECGSEFFEPMVGRGATYADIDADGDLDVLLLASGQAPRLLRNDQQLDHHWLRLKLVGRASNRDAIGAWVEVKLQDRSLWQQVMPTRSYLSQAELPLTFGLGDQTHMERVMVYWPDGTTQPLEDLEIDRLVQVEQKEQ